MLLAFRVLHVLGGVLWVGAIIFASFFLMPSLKAVGPAGGPVMNQLMQIRKMPIYMMVVAMTTIFSGAGLMWVDMQLLGREWMRTGSGRVYGWGGVFAILAVIIGMSMSAPAGKRLGALGQTIAKRGGPPTAEESAEMERLQGRMALSTKIVTVLVLLATTAMAIGRYV